MLNGIWLILRANANANNACIPANIAFHKLNAQTVFKVTYLPLNASHNVQ